MDRISHPRHYLPQHARGFIGGFVVRSIVIASVYEGKIKSQLIGKFLDQIHAVSLILAVALQLLVCLHQLGIWFVLKC